MCLTIRHDHPKANTRGTRYVPIVTDFPILVWKGLCKLRDGRLVSPYQRTPYTLGSVIEVAAMRPLEGGFIYRGLHSCTTAVRAQWHTEKVFPAIIPAGSEVFLGLADEIASTKLIVYRSLRELARVHGAPGPGMLRSDFIANAKK